MEDPVAAIDDVPKTMAEALDWDDPAAALLKLSQSSAAKAESLSKQLAVQLAELSLGVPELVTHQPPESLTACADSISHSLTKIASGGSEASQEIRTLEEEKRELERHAQDIETALALRQSSQTAADSLRRQDWKEAALAVQQYNEQARMKRHTPRALAYAGDSTVQQIQASEKMLKKTLLQRYESAVEKSDLQQLGELTPLLKMVQLEKEGVSMYMKYLQTAISRDWTEAANKPLPDNPRQEIPPYIQMARIYNCAVSILRHHLPMVSHCLYKADGDAALVQLVHTHVEQYVIPLLNQYVRDKQLHTIASNAQRIYGLLEERYISGLELLEDSDVASSQDDCGFSVQVGTMSQVDGALEEAALCLQHAESYARFVQHTTAEVNKARKLRFQSEQEALKLEREREEWATGMSSSLSSQYDKEFVPLEILPAHTQLHEVVAEVGSYYSGIERCLLLASMQRAFHAAISEPFPYSPLGIKGHQSSVASHALKTSLVETCLYAARHGMQRAFATGHTGTAAAMANFGTDCLGGVLLQVMMGRAQESGVAPLKPGEGLLLAGSSSSLASNLIRQGQNAVGGAVVIGQHVDEAERQEKIQLCIAQACATLNDLEVAVHHIKHLERLLNDSIDKGFPSHDAEQLRMCVKSLGPVTDSFQAASDGAVDSLVSVLTTRVRSIVSDAVGSEGSAASASFMGSSVMGGHSMDRVTVRMNYNLDDDAYQLLQLSEGYMARMRSSLDELVQPLRVHLAPRLSDALVLGLISLAAKRIESAIRRVRTCTMKLHLLALYTIFCLTASFSLFIRSVNLLPWVHSVWIPICETC